MSKMPAKKKSCFEITSVTQAKVAASSITDDTESLDDPDESRTEDVSSEIFDGSRGDQGVCDRSSSEETLNNAGESQEGQTHTAQPFAPTSTSFNSRFRVIKLDHGTGEPFRRGRWTCNEFYDKDSDSSVNRTVDSKKPTLTLDHSIDRDSGLGATTNPLVTSSIFSPPALENSTESGYSVGHLPHPSDPLQPGYSRNGGSAFQLPGYTTTVSQQPQQVVQPVAQTFPFNSLNGVHQGAILQNSHNMPPAPQPQQFVYPTHNPGLSAGQPDLCQQHFGSNTQNLPLQPASQVPLPSINPSGPGTQGLGGDTASAAGHQQPVSSSQPSGTTTRNSNVPNKLATGSTVPNTSQGVPDQGPGSGGPVQPQGAHGGASPGVSSGFSDHTEDSRQTSDVLPQPSAGVVPRKDSVKPLFTEGFNLHTPAVKSLLDINNISVDVDEDSASGASVVAIDNKIEQAMDLVKSHLMYAVREEVEVLKEQIKELYERNSMLERENAVLKSLANSEQLNQLTSQLTQGIRRSPPLLLQQHPLIANSTPLTHHEGSQSIPHQPNLSSA